MADDDVRLSGPQTRARYGNISQMTLWRWMHNPDLGFPEPIMVGTRLFFRKSDLDAFDIVQQRRRKQLAPAPASPAAAQV